MDFAQEQRKPSNHMGAIVFVVLLHIVIVWGFMNGLATKVVQIIQKPLETKIVEEVKPPPPPEELPPPPPKLDTPPPPTFIPPPEVQVTPPPQQQNVISTPTTPVKPTEPVAIQPPHNDAPPAPAPAPTITGSCNNAGDIGDSMQEKFSVIADKEGLTTGKLFATVTVGPDGAVRDVTIKNASHQALAGLARKALGGLRCKGTGQTWTAAYDVTFKLAD